MVQPKVKELLEAGVHFGHQTRRWNPKMKPFIFTERNGIYIIDLNKTLLAIEQACLKVREVVSKGRSILFVGTKKQAQEVVKTEAIKCGEFYVTERWLGGMLTNFSTIKSSIKKLKDIERMKAEGDFAKFTKKEGSMFERQLEKLERNLGGIKDMTILPGLVFVVDAKKEKIAVAEARKMNIPIIGIIDTNADPDPIDFPIAANDDAIKSIRIITKAVIESVMESKHSVGEDEMVEAAEKTAPTKPTGNVPEVKDESK